MSAAPGALRRSTPRSWLALHLAGAAALAAAAVAALSLGPVAIDPLSALRAAPEDPARLILLGARAPRVLLASLVGGALALAGAALQGLLRNPLASPHVLGISSGAALLAVATLIAAPAVPVALVPLAAFAGAIGAAVLVHGIARTGGRVTPHTLLLTGVVVNAVAAALITFLSAVADFYQAHGVLSWIVGSVTFRGPTWTWVAALTLLGGLGLLTASARDLNALALGDDAAASLGIEVGRVRRRVYGAVALLVAGAVPVSGMIGFVGLIVPHGVRLVLGGDQRRVLPASMWAGAVFLLAADTLARTALAPSELPVGVVTALAGGPFFLFLLHRETRREAAP